MRVHVGTSGYSYPEWRGSFYPAGLKPKDMFAFYARQFAAVEVNYTFYRMPTATMTAAWLDQAPAGFHYALKAPRRITHDRRLRDCAEPLGLFCDAARGLGPHLGPLLFQLPPTFRCDAGRLADFLDRLPDGIRTAVEFRHDSWFVPEVFSLLASRAVALCVADFGDRTTPLEATAPFGYFRLRDEGYTDADLAGWADRLAGLSQTWSEAFVFFKHEEAGQGAAFARAFTTLLEQQGLAPPGPTPGTP